MQLADEKRRIFSTNHALATYGSFPKSVFSKAKARPSIYHGEEQDKRTLANVMENFTNNIEYIKRAK